MKYLLLFALMCALAVPVFAKEIELSTGLVDSNPIPSINTLMPVYAGKGEIVLQQSDDSSDGAYYANGYGRAQWFTAPSDCHIIRTSLYYRYGDADKDITVWTDNGGAPGLPDTALGFVTHTFPNQPNEAWQDPYTDLTSLGITMTSGTVFWAGFPKSGGNTMYNYVDTTNPDYSNAYDNGGGWTWHSGYDLMFRLVINDDMDGPYAADQDPADGATGVDAGADILFDIQDDDIGVDSSTIDSGSVVVTDDTKATISGTLTVDDTDPNDVHVTFDPDSDFVEGSTVTVTVSPTGDEILDDLGNEMVEDSWDFTVFMAGVESASLGEIKANFK